MSDMICPGCGRAVPAGEIQQDVAALAELNAAVRIVRGCEYRLEPSAATISAALDVIAAAARAEVFGRHAFHFVGTLRRELAAEGVE